MYRSVRNIPKELLQQLYVVERWTLRDVADYFACSVDTIVRRMEEYGIERRAVKKEINRRTLVSLYGEG
ncbi:MAG: sortase, partial [Veillonella caviae]|nr:sortase [Veillonella caviae]